VKIDYFSTIIVTFHDSKKVLSLPSIIIYEPLLAKPKVGFAKPRYKIWVVTVVQPARMGSRVDAKTMELAAQIAAIN
jgi:hypothetical protein